MNKAEEEYFNSLTFGEKRNYLIGYSAGLLEGMMKLTDREDEK